MAKVSMSRDLSASAGVVWEIVGKFSAIDSWLPPIASCEAGGDTVGDMRKLTTVDGAVVHERLDSIDDDARGRIPVRSPTVPCPCRTIGRPSPSPKGTAASP